MTIARDAEDAGAGRGQGERTPLLEKLSAALGLVLAAGAIGFLVYEGLWGSTTPPDIAVEATGVRPIGNGFLVQLRAANQGGTTAAQVKVEGVLTADGRVVERSELTFDYVPGKSERRGGLFFTEDPGRHALELRATGFTEP